MDKLRYFAFCVNFVFVASVPAQAEVEFSYGKNTFINYWSCLGIYPGTSLGLGEKVWIFSKDISPTLGKVVHVTPAANAKKRFDDLGFDKVYKDKPLWAEIGCAHSFRGDMPVSLAQVAPEPRGSDALGFAIRGLPAGAWIAEGKGDSVAMGVKDNPYVGLVRHLVTDACYVPDSLIRVKQFPIQKGRAIIQLDIGKVKKLSPEKRKQKIEEEMRQTERIYAKWAWPEYKKKTLEKLEKKGFVESVEICRFFLDEKRVLKDEKISRRTGVDERVDTAPDLDTDNWADTTDSAIGFISLNEGKDWDVLLVDVGWEGINYSIQRLNGSVVHYNRSLYTYH
ncbi:MAG: hypothetical protein ACYC2E_05940 [Sulfuricella sp.]